MLPVGFAGGHRFVEKLPGRTGARNSSLELVLLVVLSPCHLNLSRALACAKHFALVYQGSQVSYTGICDSRVLRRDGGVGSNQFQHWVHMNRAQVLSLFFLFACIGIVGEEGVWTFCI